MGMIVGQARLMMLYASQSDLEFQTMRITQYKLNKLMNQNPNDALNEQKNMADQQEDKMLDLEMKRIDTIHRAVQSEIESAKKVVDKAIESNFKYFA